MTNMYTIIIIIIYTRKEDRRKAHSSFLHTQYNQLVLYLSSLFTRLLCPAHPSIPPTLDRRLDERLVRVHVQTWSGFSTCHPHNNV